MTGRLQRSPSFILILLAFYLLLHVFVRQLLPHGLRYDESQQAFFSQWLAWGYDNQPPLYNWLQYLTVKTFGLSLLTLSATKNLVLFAAFAAYVWLARTVLSSLCMAMVATLALFTMPPVAWEAQRNLTHTIAEMVMACLLLVAIVKTLQRPSLASYAMVGASIGVGMLTKYNFLILVLGVAIATLTGETGRRRILDRRFVLTVAIAALIFLPHGLWICNNLPVATARTLSLIGDQSAASILRSLRGPMDFVYLVFIFFALTLVIFALLLKGDFWPSLRASNVASRFLGRLLAAIVIIVLLIIIVMRSGEIPQHWLLPLFFFAPIFLCCKLEAAGISDEMLLRRLLPLALIVMVIVPTALLVRTNVPALFGRRDATNIPYARFVTETITREGITPGLILTDEWLGAGNLKFQLPAVPVMTLRFGNLTQPYAFTTQQPILVVWSDVELKGNGRPELVRWVAENLGPGYWTGDYQELALPYERGQDDSRFVFRYHWIYPNKG